MLRQSLGGGSGDCHSGVGVSETEKGQGHVLRSSPLPRPVMSQLEALAEELLERIVHYTAAAIYNNNSSIEHPNNLYFEDDGLARLASTNMVFRRLCTPILFSHLRFRSATPSRYSCIEESDLGYVLEKLRLKQRFLPYIKCVLVP